MLTSLNKCKHCYTYRGRYECDVAIKKKRELAVKAIMGEAIHYEETEVSITQQLASPFMLHKHAHLVKYINACRINRCIMLINPSLQLLCTMHV